MSNLKDYFQYKSNYLVSVDAAKSNSYFIESTDLNQDGSKDIIMFGFTFPSAGVTTAIPQGSIFYWGDGSGNFRQSTVDSMSLPLTTHPREIAYADFNNDGKLDIFLADHGWDTSPYPGGQNQLILSSSSGWKLSSSNLPTRMDFTHCTTVGDINHDGNVDIFIGNVDTSGAHYFASILLGDGTGKFTESTTVVPSEIRGSIKFYAAQLADLNGDSWLDLVIGNSGDAYNTKTQSIIYWNKNGSFENSNSTLIPNGFFGAKNEQILDIKSGDINGDGLKDLVLLSTQNNPFYDGWSVQILCNQGNGFVDITSQSFGSNVSSMGSPNQSKQMPWIAFLKLVDVNNDGTLDILFDSIDSYGFAAPESQPLIYLNDGFAHFSPIYASDIVDLNLTYRDFFSKASSFVNEQGVSWVNAFSYQDSIYFRELTQTKPLPKISSICATDGNDAFTGNELDNSLCGLSGDDVCDGGSGLDTSVYTGTYGSHTVTHQANGSFVVADSVSGRDGTDTVTNVERLQFSDYNVALDTDSSNSAGGIYRLYQAAFDRKPDLGGLGYWIKAADNGKSAVTMAEDFTWSKEFLDLFHLSTPKDNYFTGVEVKTLVDGMYTHVLHRAADAGGLNYYSGVIQSHEKTVGRVLAEISDSPENHTAVASSIANGIQYTPYTAAAMAPELVEVTLIGQSSLTYYE